MASAPVMKKSSVSGPWVVAQLQHGVHGVGDARAVDLEAATPSKSGLRAVAMHRHQVAVLRPTSPAGAPCAQARR